MAADYNEHYSTRADCAENLVIFGRALALWNADRNRPGTFLDLGCGPGTAIPYLRLHVREHEYIGVDIARGAIEVALDQYPRYEFHVGDESSEVTSAVRFVLGAFGPMQYVDDLETFSGHVYDRLQAGGRFLLMGRPRRLATRVLGSDALTRPYRAADVEDALWWARDLRFWGLRWRTPRWLPVGLQIRSLLWERRWVPADNCEWLVVEGRK